MKVVDSKGNKNPGHVEHLKQVQKYNTNTDRNARRKESIFNKGRRKGPGRGITQVSEDPSRACAFAKY